MGSSFLTEKVTSFSTKHRTYFGDSEPCLSRVLVGPKLAFFSLCGKNNLRALLMFDLYSPGHLSCGQLVAISGAVRQVQMASPQ